MLLPKLKDFAKTLKTPDFDAATQVVVDNMLRFFSDPVHRLEEKNLSYRIINHWESLGILSNKRPKGKGWRKYSIMDLVWIHLVMQLRSLGYPNEKILRLRQIISPGNHDQIDLLYAFCILHMYNNYYDYILAVDPKGDALFGVGTDHPVIARSLKEAGYQVTSPYISISIRDILFKDFQRQKRVAFL